MRSPFGGLSQGKDAQVPAGSSCVWLSMTLSCLSCLYFGRVGRFSSAMAVFSKMSSRCALLAGGAYVAQSFVAPPVARAPTAPSRVPTASSGSHAAAPALGAGVAMGATAVVAARRSQRSQRKAKQTDKLLDFVASVQE